MIIFFTDNLIAVDGNVWLIMSTLTKKNLGINPASILYIRFLLYAVRAINMTLH